MTFNDTPWWDTNEFGHWCPSCGHPVGRGESDADMSFLQNCPECGFPDDHEKMAEYFT